MNKYKYYIALAIASLVVGFYLGRQSVEIKTTTKVVNGKTIKKLVPIEQLVPIDVSMPTQVTYIERKSNGDTIYTVTPKDPTESLKNVLNDWNLKRVYANTVFNDSIYGRFDYKATVQFNKIGSFEYEFTPVKTVITKEKKHILQPFVSASYSTIDIIGVGGGFFYHDLGFEVLYNKNYINGNNGLSFGIKYKF